MGRGWFGFAFVCVLSGCSDDEPSWVPPEAGVAETRSPSRDASTYTRDTQGSTQGSQTTTLDQITQDVVHSSDEAADSTSSVELLDAAAQDTREASTSDDNPDAQNTGDPSGSSAPSFDSEESSATDAGENTGENTTDTLTNPTDGGADGTSTDEPTDTSLDGGTTDAGNSLPVEAQAGFIDVEATDYVWFANPYRSSSARLFYAFTPADDAPADAPVFVFFNGGPGSATSSCLMSYGTGPYSLPADLSNPVAAPNPWSWSQMGNLLYFDTRQAGFSYSTLEDPSDASARAAEWTERNFNPHLDAADSVRLMLRVLSQQPALRDNPIILVGESYGGTRATIMLRYLLAPEVLRTSSLYRDSALADEITSYFEANLDDANDTVTEQTKRQLPAQILLQPYVGGSQFREQDDIRCLPDSPAQQVAAEVGTSCGNIELFRDAYKLDEGATWSVGIDVLAQRALMHPTELPRLLGVALESIEGLKAADRPLAYRDLSSGWYAAPQPEFIAELGALQAWDAYHLTITPRTPWPEASYFDYNSCAIFPWVAQQVDTLITNAKWDNVVLTTALPATLYDCALRVTEPFVDGIEFASGQTLELGESGQMVIRFNERAPEGASERVLEFRGYDAGHMVTVTHAEALFRDVQAFLLERGVL